MTPNNPPLDKYLQEILTQCRKKEITEDAQVAAIHSAFKDAGYINIDEVMTRRADFNKRWNVMTGAEWYERFTKELEKPKHNDIKKYQHQCPDCGAPFGFMDAAKAASGVSEETE